MNPLRKLAVVLAVTFLPLALWGAGLSWSVHEVFGTPRHIEGALNTSGIYNSIVGEVLSKAQTNQADSGGTDIDAVPVEQPEIQALIKQAFPAQTLQAQTNQVLDATYAWLQGKQPALAFNLDLTGAKQQLANGVGQYVSTRLSSLPVCANDQIPTGDVDPFGATCMPKGFDTAAAAAKVRDNILNGDFLKNAKLTADSVKTSNGKTLSQQLQAAPTTYHRITLGMYGSALLAILLTLAVIFLSPSWRSGVRKAAIVYISVGVIIALLAWLIDWGLHRAVNALGVATDADKALEQNVLKVVDILAHDLRTYWLGYGLALLVLGVAGLVAVMSTKKRGMALAHEVAGNQAGGATFVASPESELEPTANDKFKSNKKRLQ